MSSFLTFSDGVYLQKDVADDLYLSKLDATTDYLSKTEAASTYTTDASVANTYLSKSEAASTYTTGASVANTYLSKSEAASTYTTNANVANTYLSKNNPQLSSQSTLDIRLSNGIQVSSQTTISPSTFENWNNLFGLPNVALTNDGIIFKKQPYYSSSIGYQTDDALVTKTYTDGQIATRGGLSNNNTWTGTNTFNQLPTSSASVGSDNQQLVTKGYTDGQIASQIATRGGLTTNNTWTGTNTFNQLPTSSATPQNSSDLVTKAYADSSYAQLDGDNTWTNTNSFTSLLLTDMIRVLQYTVANYDTGWFAVSSNSTYNITHNLGWSFPNPPRLRLFFSSFSTPVLGSTQIYELSVNSMSGLYDDTSNYQYGISHIRHLSSTTLRISTCVRGVYYSEGGEDVGAETSGYYRLIMYK